MPDWLDRVREQEALERDVESVLSGRNKIRGLGDYPRATPEQILELENRKRRAALDALRAFNLRRAGDEPDGTTRIRSTLEQEDLTLSPPFVCWQNAQGLRRRGLIWFGGNTIYLTEAGRCQ